MMQEWSIWNAREVGKSWKGKEGNRKWVEVQIGAGGEAEELKRHRLILFSQLGSAPEKEVE